MDSIIKRSLTLALLMTILIFVSAYMINYALDYTRMNYIDYTYQESQLTAESFLLEQKLYDIYNTESCPVLERRLWELRDQIRLFALDITLYKGQTLFLKEEFEVWKRKYTQLQLEFYNLFNRVQKDCDSEKEMILFFYEIDDQASITQGYVLQEVMDEFDHVDVLAFDIEFEEEPVLEYLKQRLNVTQPSVITPSNAYPLITYIGQLRQDI